MMKLRAGLIITAASFALLSAGCDFFADWFNNEGNTEPAAEINYTPDVPEVSGDGSKILISGSVGGETISMIWDFSPAGTTTTNGLMSSQISSSLPGTASLYFDNDFVPGSDHTQTADDWYLRFTLGNASPDYGVYNSKETFSIPAAPYSMITLRKGPSGSEYRHREYNTDNLMSAIITSAVYDSTSDTLRIAGGLKSTWGSDWITADFNVLMGGPDDRQAGLNQSTFRNSF